METALRSLLDDVCRHPSTADFAVKWGAVEESRFTPGGWLVVCPPEIPFESLDLRRWDSDGIGIVDVRPRADGEQPAWPALQDRFGPFEELDAVHGRWSRFGVDWMMPLDAPADALLLVTVDDDGAVKGITVRRDPRS